MNIELVELPASVVKRAKELTGKKSARAAVTALIEGSQATPDAKTRAFRAKNSKGSTVVRGGKDAAAFMRKFLGE